jgi:hypothetical protein
MIKLFLRVAAEEYLLRAQFFQQFDMPFPDERGFESAREKRPAM